MEFDKIEKSEDEKKQMRVEVMEELLVEFKMWCTKRFNYDGVRDENLLNFYHDMANSDLNIEFYPGT